MSSFLASIRLLLPILIFFTIANASSELPCRAGHAMQGQRGASKHNKVQPNDYNDPHIHEQNQHSDIDLDLRLGCGSYYDSHDTDMATSSRFVDDTNTDMWSAHEGALDEDPAYIAEAFGNRERLSDTWYPALSDEDKWAITMTMADLWDYTRTPAGFEEAREWMLDHLSVEDYNIITNPSVSQEDKQYAANAIGNHGRYARKKKTVRRQLREYDDMHSRTIYNYITDAFGRDQKQDEKESNIVKHIRDRFTSTNYYRKKKAAQEWHDQNQDYLPHPGEADEDNL